MSQYRKNLEISLRDELRRFLFNIHGDAGVGRTFLARQLRQIVAEVDALLLTKTAVTIGLAAARDIPAAGSLRPAVGERAGVTLISL